MHLNFKTFGEGEPFVILHGLFGMLDNWQSFAKKLSSHFKVYIVDLRNHGKSLHSEEFSYELMAQDLNLFFEEQEIEDAIILGHSMGGKAAMRLALDYPQLIEKLIVLDIAPKQYMPGHLEIFEALFSLDVETLDSRKDASDALEDQIPEFGVRQFILKNLTRNKDKSFRWKMNLSAIYEHYDKIIEELEEGIFHGECLFVKGGNSNYVIDGDEELIYSFFPNAEIEEVANAGHWVHAEKPDELLALILRYLMV